VAVGAAAVLAAVSGSSGRAAAIRPSYWDPAWSPDGRRIAFVDRGDAPGDLYVMNVDGRGMRRLTASRIGSDYYGARYPTWSPDGRRIAFGYGYDGIFVINADGSGLHRLTASGCCADWSPRGRRIAYAEGGEGSPAEIYVVRPNGTGRTLAAVPPEYHSLSTPTWSPSGERLAIYVGQASDLGFNVKRYLGFISQYRGPIQPISRSVDPWEPDWGPKGRKIAFSDTGTVALLDLRTRRVRHLRPGQHPRWSTTGRELVFSDDGHIYAMRADGKRVRLLR
jgi:Tol biopolymer transport system component